MSDRPFKRERKLKKSKCTVSSDLPEKGEVYEVIREKQKRGACFTGKVIKIYEKDEKNPNLRIEMKISSAKDTDLINNKVVMIYLPAADMWQVIKTIPGKKTGQTFYLIAA
ncbi:MAG: hypothetical protein NTY12_05550 [Candidatus Falkowbacteria bacterium]|nr:hypothetical protein [Candidatus Falkowbacteria bacterium]